MMQLLHDYSLFPLIFNVLTGIAVEGMSINVEFYLFVYKKIQVLLPSTEFRNGTK